MYAKEIKTKIWIYIAATAISFAYLLLIPMQGISVLIYHAIQMGLFFMIASGSAGRQKNMKALLLFIPIFIISASSFVSALEIYSFTNMLVIFALYVVMIIMFLGEFPSIKDTSPRFVKKFFVHAIEPFWHFFEPLTWLKKGEKSNKKIWKRILIGVIAAVPAAFILTFILASVDSVFADKVEAVIEFVFEFKFFDDIVRIVIGLVIALYFCGLLLLLYKEKKAKEEEPATRAPKADAVIFNIITISLIAVYTLFAFVQIKYLFAGAQLPNGLDFQTYARRGFFELIVLSFANISLVLVSVYLFKNRTGKTGVIIKAVNIALCALTGVMLASSFYRMWLYGADDGLTRLRFIVFGFLIFEAIGLIITVFYVLKPKFNIFFVYTALALSYYCLLTVSNMDYFIAKSQIDRYFENGTTGLHYTTMLSPDAYPQMKRLIGTERGEIYSQYIQNNEYRVFLLEKDWRSANISRDRFSHEVK